MTNTINIKEISEQINERIDKNLKLLEDSKDYKDIKEKLDKGNNFIDYFLVIGQEPIIYREKWLYTEDLDSLNKKHKEQFKPKIISSFPPFEKSTIAFDESILMHIFPNGYKLIRARPNPTTFWTVEAGSTVIDAAKALEASNAVEIKSFFIHFG